MTVDCAIPLPPLELRELVGPTDDRAFDNPGGEPVFADLPDAAYESVFDFGCGCGRIARQLIQQRVRPKQYFGLDVHRGMVAWCQTHLAPRASGFEFAHYDVYSRCMNPGEGKPLTLPFPVPDRSATLVIAHSVFTHLIESQVTFYLRECARILKPGGSFLSTWFLFDKRYFPMMQEFQNGLYINLADPSNATIFDREWLRQQIRSAGLVVRHVRAPTIRGFQWTVLMSPSGPGLAEVEFGEDLAPFGLARPPVPDREMSSMEADPEPSAVNFERPEAPPKGSTERDALLQEIHALGPWFHAIDFGNGIRVQQDTIFGGHPTYPLPLWERLRPMLPDVRGLEVLDIGCNAGFFSVEMKRAGAARVVGIEAAPQYLAQARFVRDALGLDIELAGLGVYDLRSELGTFDLTLFMGVIYHLKNPLLGLERVASVTKDLLVVESAIVPPSGRASDGKYLGPSHELLFVANGVVPDAPGVEGHHNWFIPTLECLKGFLGTVGFGDIVAETHDSHRALIVSRRGQRSSSRPDRRDDAPELLATQDLPLPDEHLRWRVSGTEDVAWFRTSGQLSVADIERALSVVGASFTDYPRALEFGCGCGRILLHMEKVGRAIELHGVDIDAEAVAWTRHHIPWVRAELVPGLPPTGFPDAYFDLVFNHSVLTHLDERYQDAWLAELQRIVRPGGDVVLSVQGEFAFEQLMQTHRDAGSEPAALIEKFRNEVLVFIEDDYCKGGPFPDFYHTAFHAPWYVFAHWTRFFEIKAYIVRGSLDYQDCVLLRRR